MARKEIVKVPFDGARIKAFMTLFHYNPKNVAAVGGCSDTTLRKAIKAGEINEVYLPGMAAYLNLDVEYLKGEKTKEYTKIDKAVATLTELLNWPEE